MIIIYGIALVSIGAGILIGFKECWFLDTSYALITFITLIFILLIKIALSPEFCEYLIKSGVNVPARLR